MNPKLRQVRAQPFTHGSKRGVLLEDPLRLSGKAVFVPDSLATLLMLLDGTRDAGTIRTGFELRTGLPLGPQVVSDVLTELDEALLLDNDRFAEARCQAVRDYHLAPSRTPTMVGQGCPSDPAELRSFLTQYVDSVDSGSAGGKGRVVGLISPHIDFLRGGRTYAWVWYQAASVIKEIELVVILGTDHNSEDSELTLTRQNYATPWGILPTAEDLVDEYCGAVGEARALGREFNHRDEHSVEAAAIWFHYFLGEAKCQVLPVLCGTFQEFIATEKRPLQSESVCAIIDIIRRARETRRTLIVAAADLAHVGPVFGDGFPLDLRGRSDLAQADQSLLETVKEVDAERLIDEIRSDGDRRRICGLPPIYLTLSVLRGSAGFVTSYEQCPASSDGTSLVSICGATFHSET